MNKFVTKLSAAVMVVMVVVSVGAVNAPVASAKPVVWNYSTCLSRQPTLSMTVNSSHPCVKILQRKLNNFYHVNPQVTVDGVFGQKTKKAVKQFQALKGLTQDGIVGPQTWNALLADYNPGD